MQCEVLIIGAGPTGLVLALWLTKQGVSVRIVSKASGPGTASRALAVHARTLELYGQCDLAEAVVADGYEVRDVGLWVDGEERTGFSLPEAGTGYTRYPFMHIFPQDRHERLLVERLQAAGISVEWNTTFLGYKENGHGIVARLAGADGTETVCEAEFLAGCDGASSPVRKAIGASFPGGTYEQLFYVADVEASGPPMNGKLNIDLEHSDFLAVFPLESASEGGHSRARLIGTVREGEVDTANLRFEDVNDRAVQNLRLQVDKVNWFSTYHVHHRVTDRFRKGRVFLLGDAAHIHSPAGGQGMNTGIGDAVNLAWKLKMVLRHRAPDGLLESYDEERKAFARRLVSTTDQAFTLATSEGRFAHLVRTRIVPAVLPFALHLDMVREFMFRTVSQLEINYRGDALSDGKAGIHGGDRLPWVELGRELGLEPGGGRSNYDTLHDMRWQVHVYGGASDGVRDWCAKNGVALNVFAWQEGWSDLDLHKDAVYLVRPDTYVALAGGAIGAVELDAYFALRGIILPLG